MAVNILFIIDRLGYGGTERQLGALINGLDKAHFNVHLLTLKPSSGLVDELNCHKEQLLIPRLLYPASVPQYRRLVKLLVKLKIHIVHTFFQDPFAVGALATKFYPAVLLGSFRDMGFWRSPLENIKMRLSYHAFDGFIANSEAVKKHFVSTDGLSSDRIKVIYNGYKNTFVVAPSRAKASNGNRAFTVGIVANFNRPVKRLEDFLKAAELAWQKDSSLKFVIVGMVADFYKETVKKAGKKMGGALRFTGSVTNPLDYINDFDVGVITSASEGFCNAIIEYMACGLPVVVTDGGGNRELVKNDINGFVVKVGDAEAMAEKIGFLQGNPELRRRMGEANRREVQINYSMAKMIREHEIFYKEMISRRFNRHVH